MKHQSSLICITLAALIIVSLCTVVSTTSVSGKILAGTGPAVSNPVGTTSMDSYVFAVGTGGTLWYKSLFKDTWGSLGGVCTASPAVVSWKSNYDRLDAFVRGLDGALWHKYYQNGWSTTWEYLGGQLAPGTGPAVSSWSAGRLDVFVEGMDGALWHKAWTGTSWSTTWESLGGKITASPAAASSASGVIDVFVCGMDAAVWYKHWDGSAWSTWTSLGGRLPPNTGPAVNYFSYRLFVQGIDHQLWRKDASGFGGWTAGVTTWATLAGKPPEALSATSPAATNVVTMDHTLVCVSTTSGNIWHSAESLTNYEHWSSAGSPP